MGSMFSTSTLDEEDDDMHVSSSEGENDGGMYPHPHHHQMSTYYQVAPPPTPQQQEYHHQQQQLFYLTSSPVLPPNGTAANDITTTKNILTLHEAARLGEPPDVLEALVKNDGYDVDQVDEHNVTPLHVACFFGRELTAKWLLERGRSAWIKDDEGLSPADYARDQRHFELARYIEARVQESDPREQEKQRAIATEREERASERDRMRQALESVRVSEKRVRLELERELRDKVRMMIRLTDPTTTGSHVSSDVATTFREETLLDLESKVVEYKRLRDVLASELKLVELAVAEMETALSLPSRDANIVNSTMTDDLYARLMRCTRAVKKISNVVQ